MYATALYDRVFWRSVCLTLYLSSRKYLCWKCDFGVVWNKQVEKKSEIAELELFFLQIRIRKGWFKAPSYKSLTLEAAFNIHRNEKKNMYNDAVKHKRGSLTPSIATCEGILDHEAQPYVKRLVFQLSKKWDKITVKQYFG